MDTRSFNAFPELAEPVMVCGTKDASQMFLQSVIEMHGDVDRSLGVITWLIERFLQYWFDARYPVWCQSIRALHVEPVAEYPFGVQTSVLIDSSFVAG